MRIIVARGVALAGAACLAVGLSAVPSNAAADRDCGDFASQRAAQIFFLKAGGPHRDPHGLDSEGDGIACETNPAPRYYGRSLPGGGNGGTGNGGTGGTAGGSRVASVVDGDTIRLAGGSYVRLIGIDTPERGRPYFKAATRSLDRLIGTKVRLVNPSSVDDRDSYGRLLRYVRVDEGRDAGLVQVQRSYAHARYDSRDGYDRHPMETKYRRTDAATRNLW